MNDNRDVTWALVTGACSGIGHAIAEELATRGHGLLLVSQREGPLNDTARDLARRFGVPTHALVLDLAHPTAADTVLAQTRALGVEVDVLINNAGMFFFGEAADADPARANAMLQLHVVTPSLLCTHFGAAMRARRRGQIMIVSSISARRDFPGIAYYASSKKYLRGFASALRSELGIYGVNVTCVLPGPVATDLYASTSVPVERARRFGVMLTPARVARTSVRAMLAGAAEHTPGVLAWVLGAAAAVTPQFVIDLLRRRSPWLPPYTAGPSP